MMKALSLTFFLVFLILLAPCPPVFARDIRGTIFDPDSSHGTTQFKFEGEERTTGDTRTVKSRYMTLSGEVLVAEETVYEKGKLRRYTLDQKQIQEVGTVEVKNGKFLFTKKRGDKVETDDEDVTPNAMVLGQMEDYIRAHWDELIKGEDINVRFAVVSRKETVGFKFFKDKDIKFHGKPAVVVKAKPASFIIALFVKPLYLTFEKDGNHFLRHVDGRLPIKYKSGDNDWSDIEGMMSLEHFP